MSSICAFDINYKILLPGNHGNVKLSNGYVESREKKRCKQAVANIPTRLHDSYHIELNNYFHFKD